MGYGNITQVARGQVYASAGGGQAFPGTTAWEVVPGTFAATGLVRFTHSAGVLTYTGPGETVTVHVQLVLAIGTTATDTSFGVSLDGGDPAAGAFMDGFSIYSGQYRCISFAVRVALTTGQTVQLKMRDAAGGASSVLTDVGAGFTI